MFTGKKAVLGGKFLAGTLMLFAVVLVLYAGSTFSMGQPGNPCASSQGKLFCLIDAFNTQGNQTIVGCAGTPTPINWFNLWYGNSPPLNSTLASNITTRMEYYDFMTGAPNGTLYNNEPLTNNTNPPCVMFVLNRTYPFTNRTTQINATIYNLTNYIAAANLPNCAQNIGCNGTMITANYVSVNTTTAGGGALPNALFMLYDNATKSFLSGPAASDSGGYWAEHCAGVVIGSNCVNDTLAPPNNCLTHGIPFPTSPNAPGGPDCPINSTTSLFSLDFISSNISLVTNATLGAGGATLLTLNRTSAMGFVMPWPVNPTPGNWLSLNVTSLNVTDYYTGGVVYKSQPSGGGDGPKGGPPFFLDTNKLYRITVDVQNMGTYTYPFITPAPGMMGADIGIPNASAIPQSQFTTVVGKVVDSSGNPVNGTVVYAQHYKGSSAFGISFINSSLTDDNGRFSVRVPSTQWPPCQGGGGMCPFPIYQFYIISNRTGGTGVPMFFPTIDNNNDRGYTVQPAGGQAILPPLTLKVGGQVNVNVTLNGATYVMSELSKFLTLGTGLTRTDVTGKFNMLSVFSNINLPSSIVIPFLSPVANGVILNLFGKSMSFGGPGQGVSVNTVCFNSTSVIQGAATPVNCNMTQPGRLNLTVTRCDDIFNPSNCQPENAGDFSFWFETNGILRNGTGDAVMYISPDGMMLQDMLGSGSSDPNITIPLPQGNYTLELAPGFEWSRSLGVYNGTNISIVAGQPTNRRMFRADSWNIQPMFNPSMIFSQNNPVNVSVMGRSGKLNSTYVTLNGSTILFLNRAAASAQKIFFGYDPTNFGGVFYNTTFRPSDFVSGAGKYWLLLNATNNQTGGDRFTTTFLMPINAYDFQVGLDLGGFTFGAGQNVSMKVFAFNTSGGSGQPPIGINVSVGNVTAKMFDSSGKELINGTDFTAISTAVTNGQGTINLTVPNVLGFYEIVTSVGADRCVTNGCKNNTFGVADNWIQVTNLNIRTILDRQNYKPTDSVALTLQVSNASSGAPLSGVFVEVRVDDSSNTATGVTDGSGKVSMRLSPSTYSSTGQWSFGWHNLKIKISRATDTDVTKLETWAGFDVRGMDMFIRADRPAYSLGDNVSLEVFGPAGFNITGVSIDGTSLAENMTGNMPISGKSYTLEPMGSGYKRIGLASWGIGHHDVKVTASSGGEQSFYTGFDVNSFNIIASTDNFAYSLNSMINLTVKANYPNGTAVSGGNVIATLYKAQPPNDINVTQNATILSSAGSNSTLLNASQPGFNYIKVNVSGQLQFIGVQVSSVKVTLLNQTPGAGVSLVNNYNGAPGGTVNIYVNATSGASNVPDNSQVTARIWAFGKPFDLPPNTTTSGNVTISFQIPTFAPSQVYGLEVIVTTPTGEQGFASPSTLTVTGGSALQLSVSADRSFLQPYKSGESALFTASLTYPNGTGASGYNITFEVGSGGTRPQTSGSAITGSGGAATLSTTAPSSDGPYFLHAYLTDTPDVQAFSGFLVSSLRVNATSDKATYAPGENITISVTIINRDTGSQVNASGGFVGVFSKEKGKRDQFFDPSGKAQPYNINISIPNEPGAIGTYPIGVGMFVNQSQGFGFVMVDVKNTTLGAYPLNITLPSTITAGVPFIANISSGLNGTASLRVFSPAASSMVYENTSIALSQTIGPNATMNITISNPGVYVFNGFVPGVGGATSIVSVSNPTTGTIPSVWTGTGTSTNATTFTASQNVYILSNTANATANIFTVDSATNTTKSYSVPLTLNMSSNYYGVFGSGNLVSGRAYFVRLDTSTASSMANTMFSVS